GIFFTATWWVFPVLYSYTDTVAYVNFSMALINLIPAYPLDGGRILYSIVALNKNPKTARIVCTWSGLILGLSLLVLFVLSIFATLNLSILFFSAFIIMGSLIKEDKVGYVKIYSSLSEERLIGGVQVKKQAVSVNTTVKKMLTLLDELALNEIAVYDNGKQVSLLTQEKINKIIEKGQIYAKIGDFLLV
ncbi:MAG: site-2 protease family protein, partial [Clostridia bacterium]|nr:site-2 protease family protein [Clostridia bacterium]